MKKWRAPDYNLWTPFVINSRILLALMSVLYTWAAISTAHAQMSERPLYRKSESSSSSPYSSRPSTRSKSTRYDRSPSSSSRSDGESRIGKQDRFYISALYSTANEANLKGDTVLFNTPSSFTAKQTTEAAPGLAAGFRYRQPGSIGFEGGAAFEMPRKSKGLSGKSGNATVTGTYEGNVSTTLLSLSIGTNYSIGSSFYLSAGINFPVVFSSEAQSFQGLPGYQAGAGFDLTDHISIQLDYRVLRMKGTIDVPPLKMTIEEATFPGFLLFLNYSI